MIYEDDYWETVTESRPCTVCGGDLKKCNGCCNGMFGMSRRRRSPEEVERIQTERLRKEEDEILARAEVIKARRGMA